MVESILLYNRHDIKFGFVIVLIILVIILLVTFKLTGGFIFKYLQTIKNESVGFYLVITQLSSSVILGLILPNNFLVKIEFFRNLYNKNDIWIPISMVIIIVSTLLAFGSVFLAFQEITKKVTNWKKFE